MDVNLTEVIWIVDQQNPSNDKTTHQVIAHTVEGNISPQAYKPTRNKNPTSSRGAPGPKPCPSVATIIYASSSLELIHDPDDLSNDATLVWATRV